MSRIRIATAVAIVAATTAGLIAAVPPATGGPAALTPDLVTLAIGEADLAVERRGARTLLRFTNEIANRADGPLEIFPAAGSANCDGDGDPVNDRDALQRLFADSNGSGAYEADADLVEAERRIGCMRYHPAHDHWHLLDVALYQLRDEATGALAARSRKVGFCLTDTRLAFPGVGSPAEPRYPLGSANPSGCDPGSTQGISAGWADAYRLTSPARASTSAASVAVATASARPPTHAACSRSWSRPTISAGCGSRSALASCASASSPARARPESAQSPVGASSGATSTGSPLFCQWASGEGGVSRRYHSASRAPMQPVPAAVTAWR